MQQFRLVFQILLSGTLLFSPKAMAIRTFAEAELDQLAGAMMMIGFQGTEVTTELRAHFSKVRPGGFILFSRNIEDPLQLRSLSFSLQKFSHLPLIAVDQEGGKVVRVKTTPALPSAARIGSAKDARLAYDYGKDVGETLRSLGINMNLAPVLDVPEGKSFLGNRSFSQDPHWAAKLGRAFSSGLLAAGVIPTAKHFPGLGGFVSDPHVAQSSLSGRSKNDILEHDLLPFSAFKDLFPSAMMLSHFAYKALDSKPAVYSRIISHDLLRDTYGYSGLVLTDDLQMTGAKNSRSIEQNAIMALRAGADIIMVSWSIRDQKKVHRTLRAAILSGDLPIEEVRSKARRLRRIQSLVNHPAYRKSLPQLHRPKLFELNEKLSFKLQQREIVSVRN
jgi:beta-N-acetylhexosaminidase